MIKRIFIYSVIGLIVASCATPPPPKQPIKKKIIKPPTKADYIVGVWNCTDKLNVGELSLNINYEENYWKNGIYELSGTLTASYKLENITSNYLLRGGGTWYFSGKDQIRYKIDQYDLRELSDSVAETSFDPKQYIPKSRSYDAIIVKLTNNEFISQIYPFTIGETICQRNLV